MARLSYHARRREVAIFFQRWEGATVGEHFPMNGVRVKRWAKVA